MFQALRISAYLCTTLERMLVSSESPKELLAIGSLRPALCHIKMWHAEHPDTFKLPPLKSIVAKKKSLLFPEVYASVISHQNYNQALGLSGLGYI